MNECGRAWAWLTILWLPKLWWRAKIWFHDLLSPDCPWMPPTPKREGLPEAEGNFVNDWHHCPTPDALTADGAYKLGDRWSCPCGQRWRVYELAHWVLWEKIWSGRHLGPGI
jgi:hypothetical protein